MRVLIIEDRSEDVERLKNLLNEIDDRSFSMECVSGSSETKTILKEEQFDLLLLDYLLGLDPGQEDLVDDGLDLLEWIQQEIDDLPIIMITAYGDAKTACYALLNGADHFIPKSELDPELLRSSITHVLDQQHQESEENVSSIS